MNILTDEEITKAIGTDRLLTSERIFASAIEAAIMSKLAEQSGEPVADVVWFDPALELFTERKPHKIIDGSLAFMDTAELGTKLYAEAQLIAAQLRTAEACAKLLEDKGRIRSYYECMRDMQDGKWREYL